MMEIWPDVGGQQSESAMVEKLALAEKLAKAEQLADAERLRQTSDLSAAAPLPDTGQSTDEPQPTDSAQTGPRLVPGSPAYAALRPASVLMPLVWQDDHWRLVLTRRAETVNSHKGQVSFPGGGAEADDPTVDATALREAEEEIGLKPADVRILGRLSMRPTISNYLVTPVVGRITRWPYPFALSADEVSRVFSIPLVWLADPANYDIRRRFIEAFGTHENVIYFHPYEEEILWGASARFTIDLLKIFDLL